MSIPPCAGLLHTATIHAEPFDRLVSAAAPGAGRLHVIDPELLATAIRTGVTPDLYAAVARHVGHLIDSGATAVEIALKLAFAYWRRRGRPEKRRFLGFAGGYHGDTIAAMAVGGIDLFHAEFGPLFPATDKVPYPYLYRGLDA